MSTNLNVFSYYFPIFIFVSLISASAATLRVCKSSETSGGVDYSVNSFSYNGTACECGCETSVCVRKCCDVNYILRNKTCVFNESQFNVSVYKHTEPLGNSRSSASSFSLISGLMPCAEQTGFYRLEPHIYQEENFFLQYDGRLWQPTDDIYTDFNDFCVEYFEDLGAVSALVCSSKGARIGRGLNALGMIISLPFLLATFIVYAILPERNMHGKCLMCYVITLFGAYLLLVIIQLHTQDLSDGACTALGTICLFFFLVSFFWMNVMSIDIWWTFSGIRGFGGSKKTSEQRRLFLYGCYAWGVPFSIVIFVGCLSAFGPTDRWYSPGLGEGQCWFTDGMPTLLYFYVPLATLIITNAVLFAKTAWKIRQAQEDTAILRNNGSSRKHNYENDKQRFNLYVKLLLAMGINWSMEIISWMVDWQVGEVPPAVWYLTDLCNALYGVFIFFIFVFKRNIWNLLRRRYYMVTGKLHLARNIAQTTTSATARTTDTSLC